ncbi:MAG: radical SAM protein [Pseudomonadota bacterium]
MSADPAARRRGALAVEVTPRCDRDCLYCYNAWRAGEIPPETPLSAEALVSLVDAALRASGRDAVQVTGGEPLLRADLFEIFEGLKAPGRILSLVTDGGGVDDAIADRLRDLGVGPVQPTLLAADRLIHDGLKGARCFDATVAGIQRLRARKVPVTVSFVCTRRNHDRFAEVLELCFALGVRSMAFSRLCLSGAAAKHRDELEPDAGMIQGCLDAADAATARLGMKVHVAISLPHCAVDPARTPSLARGGCSLSTGTPGWTIDPWGRLRACSVSPAVLGDLREEAWDVIVSRARGGYLRDVCAVPERCMACAALQGCRGGCRESALAAGGGFGAMDPLVG